MPLAVGTLFLAGAKVRVLRGERRVHEHVHGPARDGLFLLQRPDAVAVIWSGSISS